MFIGFEKLLLNMKCNVYFFIYLLLYSVYILYLFIFFEIENNENSENWISKFNKYL